MKHVIIIRNEDDGVQVLGDLITQGFYCKTLERPWKDNKSNVSCIPKGEYICKWTFSPRLTKYTYQVMNVPKRTGVRFHSASYWFNLQGCIALGTGYLDINKDKKLDLINSRVAMKEFEKLLNKEDFTLIIK